jgi:hypothetical protein
MRRGAESNTVQSILGHLCRGRPHDGLLERKLCISESECLFICRAQHSDRSSSQKGAMYDARLVLRTLLPAANHRPPPICCQIACIKLFIVDVAYSAQLFIPNCRATFTQSTRPCYYPPIHTTYSFLLTMAFRHLSRLTTLIVSKLKPGFDKE